MGKIMKLFYLVLLGVVAGLSLNNYLTLRSIESSSSAMMEGHTGFRATLPPPTNLPSSALPPGWRDGGTGNSIQREMVAMRKDMSRLREEVFAILGQTQTVTLNENEDPAIVPFSRVKDDEEQRRGLMEEIETEFSQEPVNRDWSFDTYSGIQEAIDTDETLKSALVGIECRSQTCRVELSSNDSAALNMAVMPLLLNKFASTLPSVKANHIDHGNGDKTMVLYMSSDGS